MVIREQTADERARECQDQLEHFLEKRGSHYLHALEDASSDEVIRAIASEIFAAGYELAIDACNRRLTAARDGGEILVRNPPRYDQLRLAIAVVE